MSIFVNREQTNINLLKNRVHRASDQVIDRLIVRKGQIEMINQQGIQLWRGNIMKIRTLRSGTQEIIMKQSNTFSIIFSNTQLDLQVGNMNEVNIKKVNMDTIILPWKGDDREAKKESTGLREEEQ